MLPTVSIIQKVHMPIANNKLKEIPAQQTLLKQQLTPTNAAKIALAPALAKAPNRPLIRLKEPFPNLKKAIPQPSKIKIPLISKTPQLINS
jgi:hypothetical protein